MNITTIGLDLAKLVFQVHGVDARGKACLRKQLKRAEMMKFFTKLPPCLIGMEACGSAHYWAHQLSTLGHTVKLMAPQFVKPYVKTNKNDAADAEGICEAVSRPNMRFVPVKNTTQLALLGLHRARQKFVAERTAQGNQIRGLLAEFGLVIQKGIGSIERRVPEILEEAGNGLSGQSRALFARLFEHLRSLARQVKELDREIKACHGEDAKSQRVAAIPGIGPLTATALVASIGDAKTFHNGRQLAAWLGLVPRQNSTGGKTTLLGISKRGDTWCRPAYSIRARDLESQTQAGCMAAIFSCDPESKKTLGKKGGVHVWECGLLLWKYLLIGRREIRDGHTCASFRKCQSSSGAKLRGRRLYRSRLRGAFALRAAHRRQAVLPHLRRSKSRAPVERRGPSFRPETYPMPRARHPSLWLDDTARRNPRGRFEP
jgi:transposase